MKENKFYAHILHTQLLLLKGNFYNFPELAVKELIASCETLLSLFENEHVRFPDRKISHILRTISNFVNAETNSMLIKAQQEQKIQNQQQVEFSTNLFDEIKKSGGFVDDRISNKNHGK